MNKCDKEKQEWKYEEEYDDDQKKQVNWNSRKRRYERKDVDE